MGKDWDQTLPPREIFEECLRVLKPGSFAFVMSAPRSDVQSRMVQMLEEVGFDVSFSPIYWAYATGFPKAMNIGKAVDKRLGVEREVVGKEKIDIGMQSGTMHSGRPINVVERDKTVSTSDKAKELDGSYAGYQPKPAVEVVIVAMKPLEQKGYLDQALVNQKGVTWLDSCRIPFADPSVEDKRLIEGGSWDTSKMGENIYSGGWAGKRVPSQKKKMSDKEQYDKDNVGSQKNFDTAADGLSRGNQPVRKTTKRKPREENTVFKTSGFKSENNDTAEASPLGRFAANLLVSDDVLNGGDEGSFSRYYDLDAWWENRLSKLPDGVRNTFPFLIIPKASKSEKNMGLEDIEEKQRGMLHIGQLKKQQGEVWIDRKDGKGKVKVNRRYLPQKNNHPTVKPIQLFSYLVTLGSRKDDVVLDPFAGSGTTGIACVFSERNYILIEREKEYFKIMEARIKKAKNPADLVEHKWF
jgi:precorrin-6B methylase 2